MISGSQMGKPRDRMCIVIRIRKFDTSRIDDRRKDPRARVYEVSTNLQQVNILPQTSSRKSVAFATNRVDMFGVLRIVLQFLPQPRHVDINGPRGYVARVFPDVLQ